MLNRFDINLSGDSRNFYQDYSVFSNTDSEDVTGDQIMEADDSSNEPQQSTTKQSLQVGGTDEEEFNDCVDEEENQEDEEESEDSKNELDDDVDESSDDGGRVALAYDSSQLSEQEGPPQNGHDYLRLVEKERRALPAIFSVQKSILKRRNRESSESDGQQSTSSTLSAESHKSINYVPMNNDTSATTTKKIIATRTPARQAKLLLDKSKTNNGPGTNNNNNATNTASDVDDLRFREDILTNFKRLREKIDAIRETKTVQCLEEEEKISEKQMKKTMDRSVRQANSLIKLMELGHPPQVSTLITKSQLELHLTLEKLADQCDISPNYSCTIHTDWIYSLIAALREPIESDICSTLRRIARICIAKRKLFEEKTKAATLAKQQSTSGISTSGCSGIKLTDEAAISQPTPSMSGNSSIVQQQPSTSNSKSAKNLKKQTSGKASETNYEDLVNELEEEEYTSSLLIVCIVRYYFGQADLK